MKVPNSINAIIQEEKITNYLLSLTHIVGRSKAVFFNNMGYNLENAQVLKKDIMQIIRSNDFVEKVESPYGTKYIVEGNIKGFLGKTALIVTVWIIEKGIDIPRFITAYPA